MVDVQNIHSLTEFKRNANSYIETIRSTKAPNIYELHRTGGKYALVTMCIGGGQGIAAVFERL